jgi:hypothetical protein
MLGIIFGSTPVRLGEVFDSSSIVTRFHLQPRLDETLGALAPAQVMPHAFAAHPMARAARIGAGALPLVIRRVRARWKAVGHDFLLALFRFAQ